MQTATKVVLEGSFMWALTRVELVFIFYIFPKRLSSTFSMSYLLPSTPPKFDITPENFSFRASRRLRPFSRMAGKLRKRRVWPVGAVSKTIVSKSIFSIVLHRGVTT